MRVGGLARRHFSQSIICSREKPRRKVGSKAFISKDESGSFFSSGKSLLRFPIIRRAGGASPFSPLAVEQLSAAAAFFASPLQYNRLKSFTKKLFPSSPSSFKAMADKKLLWLRGWCLKACLGAALAFITCACAAMSRPPETGRPRVNEPPYPVTLAASEERRAVALAAWNSLFSDRSAARTLAPELQPVTATLRALPATDAMPLFLPKVGGEEAGKLPTEEETRESLRRFINDARELLGVAPEDLSLVEQTDATGGARRVRYQQKPFSFPLRGGYGLLDITFTPDRRVVSLSSTAIPDTDRIERALALVRPTLTAADVAQRLNGRAVNFTDASGREQSATLAAVDEKAVRELVVFPRRSAEAPSTLAFHLAWEVAPGGATPLLIYVDALTGDTLAALPATDAQTGAQATTAATPAP